MSHVLSPAGIWAVSGLLAPFLTKTGADDLQARWGNSPEIFFDDVAATLKQHADAETAVGETLHMAAGFWTRPPTRLPEDAAARLAEFAQTLPTDLLAAQQTLDAWAHTHTAGMIPTFPLALDETTRFVLASAVALDDRWAYPTTEHPVRFAGERCPGFEAALPADNIRATPDQSAVAVTLPLASGAAMTFCVSVDGPEHALSLLTTDPESLTAAPTPDCPYYALTPRTGHAAAYVDLPAFTTRHRLDLRAAAAEWGLAGAFHRGVPGFGDNIEISDAVQDAFIEVTHTGVRAAAVTAMAFAVAAMPAANLVPVVSFTDPFAYVIADDAYPVHLFTGVFDGN